MLPLVLLVDLESAGSKARLPSSTVSLSSLPYVTCAASIYINEIQGALGQHLGLDIELSDIIRAAGGIVSHAVPDEKPSSPTVLIKEELCQDADECDRREDTAIRQQCQTLHIPCYGVQWVFDLLSYFSSPLVQK